MDRLPVTDDRDRTWGLRQVLAAIDAGDVVATSTERAYLAGALAALERAKLASTVRVTDV